MACRLIITMGASIGKFETISRKIDLGHAGVARLALFGRQ